MKNSYDSKKYEDIHSYLGEILEASFDGILVADGDGKCLFINSSYTRNTGITEEEVVGKNMRDLLNPEYMRFSSVLEAIETKRSLSLEHNTKNGKHIIVTANPILNEDGNVSMVLVNTRDMSEINALRMQLGEATNMKNMYMERMLDEERFTTVNDEIVIMNSTMKDIYDIAKRISTYDTTVLISGESGTGKELVARYIHEQDKQRKDKPFVVINCGTIPENLLESELFGYESGTFTGAQKGGKKGLFESAEDGVIFLDEINSMSLSLQVKLLRVLETHKVMRIGSSIEKEVNIRVIAAANKDLAEEVKLGNFRDDLYYRLNVVSLKLPPLRNRTDEILPLATRFINFFNKRHGQNKQLTLELINALEAYEWPGNIRELKNTIENMVVVGQNDYLHESDLPWNREKNLGKINQMSGRTLKEYMDAYEKSILMEARDKYRTTERIGKELGVDQSTISRKMKKYGI